MLTLARRLCKQAWPEGLTLYTPLLMRALTYPRWRSPPPPLPRRAEANRCQWAPWTEATLWTELPPAVLRADGPSTLVAAEEAGTGFFLVENKDTYGQKGSTVSRLQVLFQLAYGVNQAQSDQPWPAPAARTGVRSGHSLTRSNHRPRRTLYHVTPGLKKCVMAWYYFTAKYYLMIYNCNEAREKHVSFCYQLIIGLPWGTKSLLIQSGKEWTETPPVWQQRRVWQPTRKGKVSCASTAGLGSGLCEMC